jgi:hypothetical protein
MSVLTRRIFMRLLGMGSAALSIRLPADEYVVHIHNYDGSTKTARHARRADAIAWGRRNFDPTRGDRLPLIVDAEGRLT